MKSIHVFKSGKHTSSAGQHADFTESTLKTSAAAYVPKTHEAPIVISHPKSNGMARKMHLSRMKVQQPAGAPRHQKSLKQKASGPALAL